jgi:tetratricopeptide (TPR) repeat protein
MYYSYKSKRKNRKVFKILFLVIAICSICYLGIKYQQYIFFWKYTYNKISSALKEASKIEDGEKKRLKLLEISGICEDYNSKNQISAETFLLAGKIHFQLGEIYLNKTFSEYIISNCSDCLDQKAGTEFLAAIKNIRKATALFASDDIDPEYCLIMARSCYYNNYYNINEIYKLVEKLDNVEAISNIDDIRFLSIINILNKKEEYGLEILLKYGMVSDSINGRFFLASAYNIAGKYTDSIMSFKNILDTCTDNSLLKLANVNLGKIYFSRSLYKESLAHFTNALKIDDRDNSSKIWIGKNYAALGEKTKARAIWTEVLVSEQSNIEAKKLLGMM